jgi:hypothetical protein
MPINPAIAMGVRGIELQDPLAQYGRVAAIQQAQQQNLLAQQQLAQAQRAEQQQNALSAAYQAAYNPQTGDIDANRLRSTLASSGFGSQIPTVEKGLGELEVQRLTRQKLGGEIKKAEGDLIDAALKRSRGFLDTLNPMDPNAPAQYMAWHEANHRDPVLGPLLAARGVTADQSRARIEQAIAAGPAAFAQLVAQSKLGTEKFMELNKPTTQVINQDGQSQVLQFPGLGGAPTSVGTYADVPLPESVVQQKMRVAAAGAPLTKVNAYVPASEAAQAQYVKNVADERKTLREAPNLLASISEARSLIPTAKGFMGAGGEPLLKAASFLNNRLGLSIDTKGVTDATVLRTRLFDGILANLKKLDSQPSQEQQRIMQEALGNLGTDPQALERILDATESALRTRVDAYNVDVKDAESRGVKFPFNPAVKLPPPVKRGQEAVSQIPGQAPAAATNRREIAPGVFVTERQP